MERKSQETQTASVEDAIVIDLGKKKKRDIKRLRKGTGKLLDEVKHCVEELRYAGAIEGTVQPVVVVVRVKSRRPRGSDPRPATLSACLIEQRHFVTKSLDIVTRSVSEGIAASCSLAYASGYEGT